MHKLLDPDLLQSFVAIAETGSFTEAARRVGRTQSAVSMQMKRLEELLGRSLFARSGRSVQLTPDGERLLGHAHRILRLQQEALAAFERSDLEGSVSIGTPDQYASVFLPGILARFAETHPCVRVDVICDLSAGLRARLADGSLDLALVTRGRGEEGGTLVMEGPVVWAASARHCAHEQDPLPLAVFHEGCSYRRSALAALARTRRRWRVAYTSMSLAGIEAALRAGLAVSPLPRSGVGEGMCILGECQGFPPLPPYQVALQKAPNRSSPAIDRLEQHVLEGFRHGGTLGVAA